MAVTTAVTWSPRNHIKRISEPGTGKDLCPVLEFLYPDVV